ncbi:putative initiation factor [Lyophyllum shimeji]|uniref:Initiation factor n=1 Tax=Lyophyllum shimeji TaxID=47721 RepID=A0A9P3PPJ0_LYOSH|nr:putative initiation factor [Lyophyllum shimeji]
MSSSTSQPVEVPAKPPGAGRLPSLNQLAARINLNASAAAANGSTTSAPRPRLAASLLRTGSNASLSTQASTNDSTAVNAPSTRSTSPSGLSTSPPQSEAGVSEAGGDALTAEKVEKHNQEAPVPEKRKVKVGYKNIPSLDAITARLAKTRALSIDGTAKPPEPEMIEDPKTPGVPVKKPEHPLQYPWTIYHDTKAKFPYTPASATVPDTAFSAQPPESTDYEAGLTIIGEFDTVESFCRYFNWLKPPSKLERNSNYHLFKSGIKPMWEDEANANGGKWVLTMKNNPALLDRCWSWLAMALVGEELEEADEICGAVVSLRSKVDRIQVWTRSKDDVEKLNAIGKKLVKLLDVSEADGIGLEFQYNTDDRPLPNKFLSIQSMPNTSYRSSAGASGHGHTKSFGGASATQSPTDGPASAGPAGAGAFGAFGVGLGGTWKVKPRGG